MILFIGTHSAIDMYCKRFRIPPQERKYITRVTDLRGYNPNDLPEVLCVGDFYKHKAYTELRREAEMLGFKPKLAM